MTPKKLFWIILGCIGTALGAIGAVVPMLPSFPFLLLAAFSFGKSSERLHTWFINTKLYKDNIESYVNGKGMTVATKTRILITVTALMGFGFMMMMMLKRLYIPCMILALVWIFHVIYFLFSVKTLEKEAE